ncbi:hypothetical protein D2V93_16885 [Flagellimonas taeanensis]|uniref:PAP2 superfamily protein n=1 Tax=Flagellimonas taeanensis TaxID=1005926 RepID=A0A1M6TCF3_9FLAO|nr:MULTISPECIES: hypothetical protein [Allomuricauda]MDC6384065.1 hypothetical protein [Muricauda sp. SK9]MEE1962139.1 hypothetical protein [Allomuricauda taeanensis]RIV48671.1 hypothetical protein D2V93_16885 [Allomuricauda taeanensis]SFB87207.1 hypothetical protein SAMN04487891_103155 [Allomuricauda taeanensis]SHK54660.1 hypothetical protein SAMN05216293_1317 [Allomuricauda taeanensis]
MRHFYNIISYIFHPLFIPIGGTILYFFVAPYSTLEMQSGNIVPIFILTVIIPIIFFLILKNLGVISSIFLPTIQERKYPLYISCIIFLMILYKVIPNNYVHELFYFFTGLLTATGTALLLLFIKFKTSMHLLGMGSILMFMIGLSIHFETNITLAISFFTLLTGLVATSRLYLKSHNRNELLIGFLIGCCSQLIILKYWL